MSPDRVHSPIPLTPQEQAFIEKNGLFYEKMHSLPRIGGRIVGLLMVLPTPATLDEIAATLQVSHGSASTNLRLLILFGLAEKVSLPGDRRDYYQFASRAWEEILLRQQEGFQELREMAYKALEEIELQDGVRERFEEMAAWTELVLGKFNETLETWRGGDDP